MTQQSQTRLDVDTIQRDVLELLTDLTLDWDRGFGGPIGSQTKLVADLGFDSVDVVQLVIAVEEHFHCRKLPFERLLMQDGMYVDDLAVGELVQFLADQLSQQR